MASGWDDLGDADDDVDFSKPLNFGDSSASGAVVSWRNAGVPRGLVNRVQRADGSVPADGTLNDAEHRARAELLALDQIAAAEKERRLAQEERELERQRELRIVLARQQQNPLPSYSIQAAARCVPSATENSSTLDARFERRNWNFCVKTISLFDVWSITSVLVSNTSFSL